MKLKNRFHGGCPFDLLCPGLDPVFSVTLDVFLGFIVCHFYNCKDDKGTAMSLLI